MKVSRADFGFRYEGDDCFCVFKHPEDRVGVVVSVDLSGLEDSEALGEVEGVFEEVFKDIAVWAWNSALGEAGSS
jgi:hypothetical protein